MIRFLIILFVSGLLVSMASFAVVGALGFPHGVNIGRHWDWDDKDNDRHGRSLGAPSEQGSREIAWNGNEDLTVDIAAEVTYTQGPDAKVLITGPKNWIEHVIVDDGEIRFDRDTSYSWGGDRWGRDSRDSTIHIAVTAPNVRNFELNGAQDMKIKNFAQDSFDLQINGAARVRAEGTARTMRLELNGAGKAELADLINEDAKVELNGASSVVLAPTKSSDVEINGVGSAKLLTHPADTHEQVNGFGSVRYGVARGDTDNDNGHLTTEPANPAPPATPAPPAKPVAPKAKAA